MAQQVNNLLAMQETQVWSLGQVGKERSPGGGHGNHSSVLAWRNPMDRGAWQAVVHWVVNFQTPTKHTHIYNLYHILYICILQFLPFIPQHTLRYSGYHEKCCNEQWTLSPQPPLGRQFASKVLESCWISIAKWRPHFHPHQAWGQRRGSVIETYFYCFRWKSGKRALDSFSYIYFWPDQRSCRQPVLTSWFLFFLVNFFFSGWCSLQISY